MSTPAPVNELFDERGVLIEEFDVLRVFHFVAALRRERVYMYKQVRKLPSGWLVGHHLEGAWSGTISDAYNLAGHLGCNQGTVAGTRVVQSKNWNKLYAAKALAALRAATGNQGASTTGGESPPTHRISDPAPSGDGES